ncbi:hypothetical protein MJH12_17705, partial [bacterium]|nr:hypothetical protein [bacterium]
MSDVLVFIRRNLAFNTMVLNFTKKHLNTVDYITISEYKNASIYIDIGKYKLLDLTSKEWSVVNKTLDVEDILLKDRVLRDIEYVKSKEMILKVAKFFIELYSTNSFKKLVTYPVDNFVNDVMVRIARYFDIEVIGVSNFFIQGYKRLTVYGEFNKVRDVSDDETDEVYRLLQ